MVVLTSPDRGRGECGDGGGIVPSGTGAARSLSSGSSGSHVVPSRDPCRLRAIAHSASRTTRLASAAVMSAWSYGGLTSTTSMPTTGSSRQIRRTASSSCARGQPAGLRRTGARCVPGIADVDVDRQEHAVAVVGRDRERLGQALVQAARARSRSSRTSACSDRPSSPGSPARASSRAVRSAGTGRRAAHRTRSAGASADRDPRASRTRCRRCRRERRSGSSRPDPGRARWRTPLASGKAIEWSPPRNSGIAPDAATFSTAASSAGKRGLDVAGVHLHVTGVEHLEVLQAVGPQRQARAAIRRVAGSRSSGSPAGRTACRRGSDVPPSNGAPRITTSASASGPSSRSHSGTPRNVKSGPNWAP